MLMDTWIETVCGKGSHAQIVKSPHFHFSLHFLPYCPGGNGPKLLPRHYTYIMYQFIGLFCTFVFYRKSEHSEDDRNKIPKDEVEPGVKFISGEIKQDIDSMAVQIFTDLPEDNPFQLADSAQDDVLVHQQTEPVYQQLTIEDPQNDVAQSLEGVCF